MPNRFAISAFQPREKHTLSSTNNYVETFRKLIQETRRNERLIFLFYILKVEFLIYDIFFFV